MKRTAVINVVGLSESLLGPHTSALNAFRQRGTLRRIAPAFPAVTCTAQSDYVTGVKPDCHGIVGNGWYNRELAEVHFWKQSNHLVRAPKVWDKLRAQNPQFTCAKLFWWFNMYSTADWSITPRPIYPADGRKIFDIYTWPHALRAEIKTDLGEFPFHTFWGPAAGVQSPQGSPDAASRWIAASAKWVENRSHPTLNLIYLPHLDYNLQRLGPNDVTVQKDLVRIDEIVGDLISFFDRQSVQVLLVSEYGISAVHQPVHINRVLREHGWLVLKDELGRELLDDGASRAFAVADHQLAHIYLNDPTLETVVRKALEGVPGIEKILGKSEATVLGIRHDRAGDLVAVAAENSWFTYYYWLDDSRAPDFARTVDIHRKPGYDPVELFLDPAQRFVKGKIAWRLLQKKLGLRMLMDVVPLDASLVKGSHGRIPQNHGEWPVLLTRSPSLLPSTPLESTSVCDVILRHVLG